MPIEFRDGHRFDALGRALAATPGRRGALRVLVGGLVAVLAGTPGRGAVAACKRTGRRCDRNAECCAGATCRGGRCSCKSGFDECGNDCVKLDIDERHCGTCATACTSGERCCGGNCVDLRTDSTNCGACGTTCPETEACRFGGNCASCFPNTACGGVCVDLEADRDNCGACGIECNVVNEFCGNGFCRACDLFAGERPCVSVCCTGGRACVDGECERF